MSSFETVNRFRDFYSIFISILKGRKQKGDSSSQTFYIFNFICIYFSILTNTELAQKCNKVDLGKS